MSQRDFELLEADFKNAQKAEQENIAQNQKYIVDTYDKILRDTTVELTDEVLKIKEKAILGLANVFCVTKQPEALVQLSKNVRPMFQHLAKAKSAKIIRTIIEKIEQLPNTQALQITVCEESAEWAKSENRNFLRQRVQVKLASLYYAIKEYTKALDLIQKLSFEVRKLDDKKLLVEIHLIECKVLYAVKDYQKAKSALISGRTAANAIYVSPLLQAKLDIQSGILHSEEKDFKTAYSYFYEAWDAYHNEGDRTTAIACLKYMCLSKIMTEMIDDVTNILSSNNALEYQGDAIESMRAIAAAYRKRSLHDFEDAIKTYPNELVQDPVINRHVQGLYDKLLEQHLLRIIEPYSRVQIAHIAKLIGLPRERVERKLSQMILDQTLSGTLDQGRGGLIVYDVEETVEIHNAALDTIANMDRAVDAMFEKTKKLKSY